MFDVQYVLVFNRLFSYTVPYTNLETEKLNAAFAVNICGLIVAIGFCL